jgi:tetratricopeptide (TPR) repeat protein
MAEAVRAEAGALLLAALLLGACAAIGPADRATPLAFPPDLLRAELERRAGPGFSDPVPIPFEIGEEAIAHARREVMRLSFGRDRIERLVALLTREAPEGFGLRYRWSRTAPAAETLLRGEGNCMSLASVLVGLARGLGWQAYYAEAGDPMEEEGLLEADLGVLSDHMVVVLVTSGHHAVVDFLGAVEGRALHIIDDLSATGHLLNNQGFEEIVNARQEGREVEWDAVARRFELATRVDPGSARAWNNLGIALARVGRISEARRAYVRARMLDAKLSSPERNLRVLRTRVSEGAKPAIEVLDGQPQAR